MSKFTTGLTAGLLAGAAGATAKNAASYLDQVVAGDAPPSSPDSSTVAATADTAAGTAGRDLGSSQASALGNLGGLGIGLGVGAVAGLARGGNATPNPVVAATLTGVAAMAVGDGLALATGASKPRSTANLVRDLVAHLAYGAVTAWALHRMVDPRTPTVARLNPFS